MQASGLNGMNDSRMSSNTVSQSGCNLSVSHGHYMAHLSVLCGQMCRTLHLLVRPSSEQHRRNRAQDQRRVEADAPVLDVVQVEPDHLLKRERRAP